MTIPGPIKTDDTKYIIGNFRFGLYLKDTYVGFTCGSYDRVLRPCSLCGNWCLSAGFILDGKRLEICENCEIEQDESLWYMP